MLIRDWVCIQVQAIVDCVPRAAWWRLRRVRSVPALATIGRYSHQSHRDYVARGKHDVLCPNGQKKVHCMLARRASCRQLRLGDPIRRNVHTARFNARKFSYRPLQWAKCSYHPPLDCPRLTTRLYAMRLFPPIWTQNVVCTSSDMMAMWLVWITLLLRSGEYTSRLSPSPPCRPWFTIYYCVLTGGKQRIACLRVERHAANCASTKLDGPLLTSHSSQSPPCRSWHTIYYCVLTGGKKSHCVRARS